MDSIYSHRAWFDSIYADFGVKIPFPVIADQDLKVAELFGMIAKDSNTDPVRSVFFIDPESTIRATLTYPATIGRNIDELLRVIDAFVEDTVSGGYAIPPNWRRGEATLSQAPNTVEPLNKRRQGANETGYRAWYYKVNA